MEGERKRSGGSASTRDAAGGKVIECTVMTGDGVLGWGVVT
jgi:hypothetical protein